MNTVKKYGGTLLVAAKGIAEKMQYKFVSRRTHFRTKLLRNNY